MALENHSCAKITAMWFDNFWNCNLQPVDDGELHSTLVFFQVLFEWIYEYTKQITEYKNSVLYTWSKHLLHDVKLRPGMLDCKDYEFYFMQIKLILRNMYSTHYNCTCSILSNVPPVSHCHRWMSIKGGNLCNIQATDPVQLSQIFSLIYLFKII